MTALYQRAAILGNVNAQFQLGLRYLQGVGTTKSFREALHWFQQAAYKKHPQAEYYLGLSYLKLKSQRVNEFCHLPKNVSEENLNRKKIVESQIKNFHDKAVKYLERSAFQGEVRALCRLKELSKPSSQPPSVSGNLRNFHNRVFKK